MALLLLPPLAAMVFRGKGPSRLGRRLITGFVAALGIPALIAGWGVVAALLYVAIGPSIIAYWCWGIGVAQAGPAIAGFFNNLTPLFAALLSTLVLGEWPQAYHGLAFALVVAGIAVSSRR